MSLTTFELAPIELVAEPGQVVEITVALPGPVELVATTPAPIVLEATTPAPIVLEAASVGIPGPAGATGATGPTGAVGPVGPAGPVEVFVQTTQPATGATAWHWFETDALGDLTGNEYIWRP